MDDKINEKRKKNENKYREMKKMEEKEMLKGKENESMKEIIKKGKINKNNTRK